ncbi:hypothetical protein [Planomicrobium sp. YIM 101495]|uniref:hypothetical protein n=1 Tax=Planomicrobium sp. YIM 101495 TaxID=2665160 RepID=UPI0012B942F2|nr:hypothetical protein [Planomicrobium sp. YIM 101495]MTD32064.1 hypothetical protein [Planomicrobium sp. YIM 101495]
MAVEYVKEVKELLACVDFGAIWDDFRAVPFAIYDEREFFLSEDLRPSLDVSDAGDGVYRGKVDERFAGNTAAQIGDHVLAIWDASTIGEYSRTQLAAYLAHEMFHAHQFAYREKRFPNELLGAAYPLTVENLHLRFIEREFLLGACTAGTEEEKREALSIFFALRKERERLIGEFLAYEKAVESVEGTAVYVEYRSFVQLQDSPVPVEKYLADYRNTDKEQLKIRGATYSQGMLLALLADALLGDWKADFVKDSAFLSDFLEQRLTLSKPELDVESLKEKLLAEKEGFSASIAEWERERDEAFAAFERHKGLCRIEGAVKVKGIDPMNLLKRGDEVIHRNFLKIDRGNGVELLEGPLKAKIGDSLFDVKWIEW